MEGTTAFAETQPASRRAEKAPIFEGGSRTGRDLLFVVSGLQLDNILEHRRRSRVCSYMAHLHGPSECMAFCRRRQSTIRPDTVVCRKATCMKKKDDPYQSQWWKRFEDSARNNLVPKMEESATVMSLYNGGVDVKMATEMGFAMMLDKPIILAVKPGVTIPNKLAMIADEIVEVDMTPESAERDMKAVSDAIARLGLGDE